MIALIVEYGVTFEHIEDISLASYLLLYTNSAINPILYSLSSSSFREEFVKGYRKIYNLMRRSHRPHGNSIALVTASDNLVGNSVRLMREDLNNVEARC